VILVIAEFEFRSNDVEVFSVVGESGGGI